MSTLCDEPENRDLLRRLDAWTEADDPGPLIRWAAAHLRGCVGVRTEEREWLPPDPRIVQRW